MCIFWTSHKENVDVIFGISIIWAMEAHTLESPSLLTFVSISILKEKNETKLQQKMI